MSGYYQAISNDCHDLGIDVASSCMGQNVNRTFPSSAGSQSQLILGDAREAPGCYGTSAYPSPNAWEMSCY